MLWRSFANSKYWDFLLKIEKNNTKLNYLLETKHTNIILAWININLFFTEL